VKRSPLPRTNTKRRANNFVLAYGSEERVEWMHGMECACSSYPMCTFRIEVAHVISKKPNGRGGPDDTVPLCDFHHRTLHSLGIDTFQERYDVDLTALAKHYAELWDQHQNGLET